MFVCSFAKLVHQGEEGDPEKVRDAIEQLGADRIGHGIQIAKSKEMLDYIIARGTPLEVSVSRWVYFGLEI
jgi:adenosine deaminase